jgi:sugar lactone lactonase YvrE
MRRARLRSIRIGLLVLLAFLLAIELPVASQTEPFPTKIDLPRGFGPEGIEIGQGHTFYVGSIPTGAIYKGDLRTGEGDVFSPGGGTASLGLALDQGHLFVAGGPTGNGKVIDTSTGEVLRTYQFTQQETFINDAAIAGDAAYFTDSLNPFLYRVPLDLGAAQAIPLTGDLQYQSGFNVNGIDATPNGKTLILVQSNTGQLFTADPQTGVTEQIDGVSVPNGDGILLSGGHTLYVVQNFFNKVAVVQLSPDLSSGEVVWEITNSGFDIPTTIDEFGNRLYAVNARFTTPPDPPPEYWLTGFTKQ